MARRVTDAQKAIIEQLAAAAAAGQIKVDGGRVIVADDVAKEVLEKCGGGLTVAQIAAAQQMSADFAAGLAQVCGEVAIDAMAANSDLKLVEANIPLFAKGDSLGMQVAREVNNRKPGSGDRVTRNGYATFAVSVAALDATDSAFTGIRTHLCDLAATKLASSAVTALAEG